MIQKIIDTIDGKKPLQNASIMKVMKILVLAWKEVTPKAVKNCFKKAGFSEIEEDDTIHQSDDPLRVPINESILSFHKLGMKWSKQLEIRNDLGIFTIQLVLRHTHLFLKHHRKTPYSSSLFAIVFFSWH